MEENEENSARERMMEGKDRQTDRQTDRNGAKIETENEAEEYKEKKVPRALYINNTNI